MLSRNKKLLLRMPIVIADEMEATKSVPLWDHSDKLFFFLGIFKVLFGRYSAHIYSSQNPIAALPLCKNTGGDTTNMLMLKN